MERGCTGEALVSPLIAFGDWKPKDILDEWDYCSCCGRATGDYVTVRLDQTMVNICDNCIHGLDIAYKELARRRAELLARETD